MGSVEPNTDNSPTDEQLLTAWKLQQCRTSVDSLLDRHLPRVRGLVIQMGVRRNDVDDVTQEILVRVFRGLDSFQSNSKFSTWIYVIAVNRIRQYFSGLKRKPEPGDLLADVADKRQGSPEQFARFTETSQAVQTAIDSLSDPLRLAIVLTSLQGMGTGQAAEICNCSENAFYARIHKARKLLKQKLAGVLQ